MANLNKKSEPEGTLPFKFTIPVFKLIKQGTKIFKMTLAEYHLSGFTRTKGHVSLIKIEKENGENDVDILPDLEMMDNPKKMEEFEMVCRLHVNNNYWNENNLSAVK